MKCLNIIVFYDNRDEIVHYIEEVNSKNDARDIDIALVINQDCNSECDDMIVELKKGYNNIIVYNFNMNVGYLNAMLKVLPQIDLEKYKYVVLSNTDIQYNTDHFFEFLLHSNYNADVGCIAPSVYSPKYNSYSNPHYLDRIPKKKMVFLSIIFSNVVFSNMYIKLAQMKSYKVKNKEEESQYVYSPHGCFMIFTTPFVKKINGYIYGAKLYSEESCIGELLLRYNMKCFYDSKLKVIHQESTITGKINYRRKIHYLKESYQYILKEFYSK